MQSQSQAHFISTDPGPVFWCPHCTIGRMEPTDTSPLTSEMEKDRERQLAKQVNQTSHGQPWHLHDLLNVPVCTAKCLACSRYVEHLSLAMAGLPDDEAWAEWSEEDPCDDQEEKSTDMAEDGDDSEEGWAPPTESDFHCDGEQDDENAADDDDEEDTEKDAELVPHMRILRILRSARGRSQTNHLFSTDTAILGRAQETIAHLMVNIAELQKQQDKVLVETFETEQKIKIACALRDGYYEELQRTDNQTPRKRPTTGPVTEIADDPMTGETQPMQWEPEATEEPAVDIVQLAHRLTQVSVDEAQRHPKSRSKCRNNIPAVIKSPKQLARWIQNNKCETIKGVPACGPDWIVDLRDARGYQVMTTLVPRVGRQRAASERARRRNWFLAILRILIIPGEYAKIIEETTAQVAAVELSAVNIDLASNMDQLPQDTVARHLASKGLTLVIADDVWQFCVKFTEAEIHSHVSGYNRETLVGLLDRGRTVAAAIGEPPGACLKSEDIFAPIHSRP
ncbi:hypothetical protein B0H11DRAFT_1946318 [Mycena galericulata]|nr:hypothetical protein B0H11DRAFT_1946318 [Mycena galericulata]